MTALRGACVGIWCQDGTAQSRWLTRERESKSRAGVTVGALVLGSHGIPRGECPYPSFC